MRRIDLVCKLLAPIVAGVLLQYAEGFTTTLVVAGWNVVSFFGELSLLWAVYRMLPSLAIKKLRKRQEEEEEEEEEEKEEKEEKEITSDEEYDSEVKVKPTYKRRHAGRTHSCEWWLRRIFSPYYTLKNGFKIFIRQEIALVGFALAAIYLTVLGFSGVTAAYFLTQGLNSGLIGLFQGVGGILGICGTILYPPIRRRVGTVRAGLIGFSLQLTMLLFSGAAVFAPGVPISSPTTGYYSPQCPNSTEFFPTPSPSPFPSPSPSPSPGGEGESVSVSLVLMLIGVVGARFGLWMFDLTVWQLVQEKVKEEERGVVSGVMNAMNSIMDMLHYVLVLAAPRPEHFRWLALLSVAMVFIGWLLYASYVRKARGHFFHFSKLIILMRKRERGVSNVQPHMTVINTTVEVLDSEEDKEVK